MTSGVRHPARSTISDAYRERLNHSVFRFPPPSCARCSRPPRTARAAHVFAEGEDERVLRGAQAIAEETTDKPILIGRPEVIDSRIERAGLTLRPADGFELVNPEKPALPRHLADLSCHHGAPRRHP